MRLLIITQYFPPETGAPQARLYELAKRLKDMGHEIAVLTTMPNYPTGKIFKGYRYRARLTEVMEGIKVVRTCLYPSKSSKTLPRLLSYLSFGIASVLLGIWGLGKQDVVLIESPPLFLVPFGLLAGKITEYISKSYALAGEVFIQPFIRSCFDKSWGMCSDSQTFSTY